jgi:hypothetical protein
LAYASWQQHGHQRCTLTAGYPLEAHKYMIEHSRVHVDTALTYCHYSLNDTTLEGYLDFYKANNIGVINASVGPALAPPFGPDP